MIVHKFYETSVDEIPGNPSAISAYTYKLLHNPDFSLVKYSTGHAFDLIKGMQILIDLFLNDRSPEPIKKILRKAQAIIDKDQFSIISKKEKADDLS